jgi:ankyrin repeat protein
MSRRSSVTSATSDSSSPVSTTCGQFTPSTDSWEPLPIQQHPVDYSKADLLSDSLIKEGQQTLLRLIDDLPPENSTSESRMTRLRGLSVIETLICAGNIQPEFETGIGDAPSPLHLAVRKRDAALVELLLRYGASMGTRNSQGETALHVATRTDDLDMVKALLSDDIRFSDEIPIESPTERANKLNNQGHPALWWAAAEGSSNEVFKYLLTLGPEVVNFQCEDVDLPTALWAAASLGRLDEARALLRNGADPMVRDRDQSTLLHKAYWPDMAHRSGFDAAGLYVDLLERPNIDAAARDREGRQPIHFAAAAGELAMCRALLNHLRDRAARQPQQDPDAPRPVDAGDNNGATPLMFAAGTGQIRVVRMLIAEYQADVRAVDRYGSDAFAAACERGFLTTAVLLLGAYPERDLDMMNQSGETALARAQRNGHTNVVNWLVELGARTG